MPGVLLLQRLLPDIRSEQYFLFTKLGLNRAFQKLKSNYVESEDILYDDNQYIMLFYLRFFCRWFVELLLPISIINSSNSSRFSAALFLIFVR